jgi:competence protein ComEC
VESRLAIATGDAPIAAVPHRYQPLVPAALAFLVGILIGEYVGGGMLLWCAAAVAAAVAWAILSRLGVRQGRLLLALLVLVAAAGAARYRAAVDPPLHDVARLAAAGQRLVVLEGIVVRSARQSSPPDDVFLPTVPYYTRSTLRLDAERVEVDGRWTEAGGRVETVVRQAIADAGPRQPDLGDRVRVVGVLLPLGEPVNPGAFDVAAYQRSQGVRAHLRTDHWEAIRVVKPAADPVRWAVGAVGRWAVERLDRLPTEEGRAMAAAMLFGRRDLLDLDSGQSRGQNIEHAFLATGTVHFMAVSGFNVVLVVAPILILLRVFGLGLRATAMVVAAAVLGFVLMTEMEPPVLRAAIFVWVICLGWLLGREPMNLNTLAAGVLVVLLVRPGDLFSLSFQLSILAVLGIMYLAGRIEGAAIRHFWPLGPPPDHSIWYSRFMFKQILSGTLIVSIAATVAVVPLVASKFHIVAWLAPIATTILFPLVLALTISGMVLVAFGWIAPSVADLLAIVPDAIGRAIAVVVQTLAAVPGVYFYVGDFSLGWLVVTYGLLAAWIWRERLGLSRRRLAMAALAAAAMFLWTGAHRPPDTVRATFISVGSGNANLLEFPDGRCILYDAGSALSHVRAAETATAPALWSRGVSRLDAIFLSHPHFDHFKDILPLVERFGVRRVFVPPTFMRSRLRSDNTVVEALLERGVRVEFFSAGDRLGGLRGADLVAVWPRGPRSQTRAINDGSLALVVSQGPRRLLLTGDIELAAIATLLEAEPDLRADAMLWPHHGHNPEAVGRLAAAVGARTLVVSAGRPVLALPDPPWLVQEGARCYRTGEAGAVTLELRPEGVWVETFLSRPQAAADVPEHAEDDPDAAGDAPPGA